MRKVQQQHAWERRCHTAHTCEALQLRCGYARQVTCQRCGVGASGKSCEGHGQPAQLPRSEGTQLARARRSDGGGAVEWNNAIKWNAILSRGTEQTGLQS